MRSDIAPGAILDVKTGCNGGSVGPIQRYRRYHRLIVPSDPICSDNCVIQIQSESASRKSR